MPFSVLAMDNPFINIFGNLFGYLTEMIYFCTVRTSVLAIRAESRERQDLIDTASEQDITDTTPRYSHPVKGGFLLA